MLYKWVACCVCAYETDRGTNKQKKDNANRRGLVYARL